MRSFTNRLSGDIEKLREYEDPATQEKVKSLAKFLVHFQHFL
jgi:hypothetical protein